MHTPLGRISGEDIRMDNRKLDYIDHVIMNAVKAAKDLNDREIAEKLHCPRTLLLSRLEKLLLNEYISYSGENFSLTEKGISRMVCLQSTRNIHSTDMETKAHPFVWDNLYIPDIGWDKN